MTRAKSAHSRRLTLTPPPPDSKPSNTSTENSNNENSDTTLASYTTDRANNASLSSPLARSQDPPSLNPTLPSKRPYLGIPSPQEITFPFPALNATAHPLSQSNPCPCSHHHSAPHSPPRPLPSWPCFWSLSISAPSRPPNPAVPSSIRSSDDPASTLSCH